MGKISHYGLVHSVIAKEIQENEPAPSNTSSSWYAYVDMYSEKAIQNAYLHLKKDLIINSKPCKVRKVKSRKANYPLSKDKCEALANYYLGFNGWTTELLYHKHESSSEIAEHPINDIQTEKYASAIRICLPRIKNG